MAKTWPYPRYKIFEGMLRDAAKEWFIKKGFDTLKGKGFALNHGITGHKTSFAQM